MNNSLTNISPIDGRYQNKTIHLNIFFSEYGLIQYRLEIEIEYFIQLIEFLGISDDNLFSLRDLYWNFTEEDAQRIKEIESQTNHDVKAVEYFIKEKMENSPLKEFIHFGLTSQDINNTAIPLLLKDWLEQVFLPKINLLKSKLQDLSNGWSDVPMLARTHGQAASPTRLGKEIQVFIERLDKQIKTLQGFEFECKFGGATGNFNAHTVAYPNLDWSEFADNFTESLGLKRNKFTTQIDHYDNLAELFDNLRRINVILIDFCRDIWTYISQDYFKQQTKTNEVGSSAMPHKVNPIDFENAEGNLGISNALFNHFSEKLPISRLQRDLTDSTVLRNIGVPISHQDISIQSILKGLDKLLLNEEKIREDLDNNWAVVSEAIQTILRREFYPNPYEKLKELTRGKSITKQSIHEFIEGLDVSESLKSEMKMITPFNYTGI